MPGREDPRRRFELLAGEEAAPRTDPGFRVERPQAATKPDGTTTSSGPARVYIYADIGGWFGVWPEEIIAELGGIDGEVELHIHSPGGDAFDGVAIYNAFKDHDEKVGAVNVEIDGLAASAASLIAMAGRNVKMKRGSQLMIHEAWGVAIGPAEDMGAMQDMLNRTSQTGAEIYAAKAGGSADEWRKAMKAETWYRDTEAVEAGLADEMQTSTAAAKNRWDLQVFAHAGRDAAPDPMFPAGRHERPPAPPKETPAQAAARMAAAAERARAKTHDPANLVDLDALAALAKKESQARIAAAVALINGPADTATTQTPDANPATGQPHTQEEASVPFDAAKYREAFGLAAGLSDDEVKAAALAALTTTETPAAPVTPPAAPAAPASTGTSGTPGSTPADLAAMAQKTGAVLIDASQLDEMRRMAALGQEAHNTLRVRERDEEIGKAINQGKIALSRQKHWQTYWDSDPEGARQALNALQPNLIPVETPGYAGAQGMTSESDVAYKALYGDGA